MDNLDTFKRLEYFMKVKKAAKYYFLKMFDGIYDITPYSIDVIKIHVIKYREYYTIDFSITKNDSPYHIKGTINEERLSLLLTNYEEIPYDDNDIEKITIDNSFMTTYEIVGNEVETYSKLKITTTKETIYGEKEEEKFEEDYSQTYTFSKGSQNLITNYRNLIPKPKTKTLK